MEIQVFDAARIEHALVTDPKLDLVFRRYFPQSFRSWDVERHGPVPLTTQYEPLECIECNKDERTSIALITLPSNVVAPLIGPRPDGT